MVGQPFNILQKKYDILPKKLKLFLKIPFLHYFPSNHTHFEPYSWKKTFQCCICLGPWQVIHGWVSSWSLINVAQLLTQSQQLFFAFCKWLQKPPYLTPISATYLKIQSVPLTDSNYDEQMTGDKESLLGNFQAFSLSEFCQWRAVFSQLTYAVQTRKVKNVQTVVFAAMLV